MKRTMKLLYMAALVLMGAVTAGCTSGELVEEQPENKSKTVTLTTKVSMDGAATKALTATGVKTFAEGETMAVIYDNGTSKVKAVSHALEDGDLIDGGKSARFTFDLETPNTSVAVTYIYPAVMADETGVDDGKLNLQDGTLASLSSSLDLATQIAAWEGTSLPAATLVNRLAILAISLKDSYGNNISSITSMTISYGTYNYAISPKSNETEINTPVYVALRPRDNANIAVTVNDGSKNYTKSLTGKTYAAGNGYNVTWNFPIVLNISNPIVGHVICVDGKNYVYSNRPGGITAIARICYVDGTGHGLALALTDEGFYPWEFAMNYCGKHKPAVSGGAWKLASYSEWNDMALAMGGCDKLRDGFSSVDGTDMKSTYYWTSATNNDTDAYFWNFSNQGILYDSDLKTRYHYARACLAF